MIVRSRKKKAVPERRGGFIFMVKEFESGEVVGEFKSFPSIPDRYCDEEKYRIIYREER